MSAIWEWLKKWGGILLGAVLFLFGAGWLWNRSKRARLSAEDRATVAEAERDVAALKARRDEVRGNREAKEEEIGAIDLQIEENKAVIEDRLRYGAGMTDEEILREFDRLGL